MATTRVMTAEELWRLPDDGYRHELYWGELRRTMPSGGEASHIGVRFGARLLVFVEEQDLGFVTGADGGYLLARDPDVVLAPDAAFVRADRVPPPEERTGFLAVPPDLAVEVVSPGDSAPEVAAKVAVYHRLGVRLVWVADPGPRTVAVHSAGGAPHVLREGDVLDGGDVLPGFRWPVADIFR